MCGQSLWFIKYRVAHTQLPSSLEGQIIMILNSSDAFKRADYSFFFFCFSDEFFLSTTSATHNFKPIETESPKHKV